MIVGYIAPPPTLLYVSRTRMGISVTQCACNENVAKEKSKCRLPMPKKSQRVIESRDFWQSHSSTAFSWNSWSLGCLTKGAKEMSLCKYQHVKCIFRLYKILSWNVYVRWYWLSSQIRVNLICLVFTECATRFYYGKKHLHYKPYKWSYYVGK